MHPVVYGEKETRRQNFLYTIGLVIFILVFPLLKVAGNIYFILSFILGCWLIYTAWRVYKIEAIKLPGRCIESPACIWRLFLLP